MKKPTQYQPMMPIGQSKASGNPSDATWWPTLQLMQVAMAMAMFTMYFSFMLFASCDGNGNVYNILFNYALCMFVLCIMHCSAPHAATTLFSISQSSTPASSFSKHTFAEKTSQSTSLLQKTARKALKLEAMTVAHPVLTVPLLWKFSQYLSM